ncbi:MAG: FAD-dependent oxidoreductase [Fimbriimonadaceae bacterium]|nr:FAD-dependent oxidoreductase [Chitinophagales bacterium]
MKTSSGISLSFWAATEDTPKYNPLNKNDEADICIIGGGITGLTCAYLLAKEGKKIILLEGNQIAGGETARTTAHITNVIDDRYYHIEKLHGEKGAYLAAESQTRAINEIEKIVIDENMSCDFERVDGYLFFTGEDKNEFIEHEFEASQRAGIQVEKINNPPVPISDVTPVFKYERQAQFHPLKYMSGLAEAATKMGVKIFTQSHVKDIEKKDSHVLVTTESGNTITAGDIIVATNSPISDMLALPVKEFAYRSYVIAASIPKGSVAKALYWDTEEPYHYVRIYERDLDDILIIGGEDHKTGQDDEKGEYFFSLETWARKIFPGLGIIEYKWSGQIMETMDGLSFIGPDPEHKEHVYIATGDSGMGITHATFSSILLTDMIMGRENEWAKLYDPKRKTLRAAKEFFKETLNMAAQYVEYITPGETKNPEDIIRGEGAIIRKGLKKYAVYHDHEGTFQVCSAYCTHLKGIVQWNVTEKTWDCPCHGARFDKFGKVINGPAISDLEKVDAEKIIKVGLYENEQS